MLRKNWKSSFFIGSVTFEGWMFMKALAIVFAGLVSSGLLENGESFGAAANDATQTVSGGGVTAKVTYLNPKSSDEPRFQVVLDTHSVALDSYDLKAISLLRDDTGKTYLPNAVENKGSGHHREVILTFRRCPRKLSVLRLLSGMSPE
jgi:hypothetical protein